MKYEITKGSEKDFDGAPEWATECVWNDKGSESFCYWLNPKTKTIFNPNWHSKPDCWNEEYGWRNYIKAERRPITEPVWDGEGLPPVGIECKHLPAKHCVVPHKVTILAHTKLDSRNIDVAVFQYGDVISFSDAKQFIPIRSPEEVAKEKERSEQCDKIFGILSGVERTGNRSDMAEALYDAGYRKME